MIEQLLMEEDVIVGFIGLAVLGVAALFLGDLKKERPVPETVEERIDDVVGTLNRTFGRRWSQMSARSLKSRLRRRLPDSLVSLVDVVHMAEDCSDHSPLSGPTKRWWAAQQALREGLV